MALTLNGSNNTIAGVAVGGLPDGIVDTDMIAANAVTAAKRGAGAILQVVQGIKTDTSSNSTSATYWWNTDVTVAITPSHANNKILLTGYISVAVAGPQHNIGLGLHKAGSVISGFKGDTASSRATIGSGGTNSPGAGSGYYHNTQAWIPFEFLDTAGGTSAITYGIAIRNPSSISRTIRVNYADTDTDDAYHMRAVSVITATEVAA